jgi:hypothetical protein
VEIKEWRSWFRQTDGQDRMRGRVLTRRKRSTMEASVEERRGKKEKKEKKK